MPLQGLRLRRDGAFRAYKLDKGGRLGQLQSEVSMSPEASRPQGEESKSEGQRDYLYQLNGVPENIKGFCVFYVRQFQF